MQQKENNVVELFPGVRKAGSGLSAKGRGSKGRSHYGKSINKDPKLGPLMQKYYDQLRGAFEMREVTGLLAAVRTADGSIEIYNAGFTPLEALGITKFMDIGTLELPPDESDDDTDNG